LIRLSQRIGYALAVGRQQIGMAFGNVLFSFSG
jgi:hypothetical protein